MIKHFSIYSCCLFLSACASLSSKQTTPLETDKITNYTGNDVQIYFPSYPIETEKTKNLSIINRSDTAKVVGLKVAQFVFGGSTTSFDKNDLTGNEITDIKDKEIGENPIIQVQKNIKNYLDEYAVKHNEITEKIYIKPIYLSPTKPYWSLTYNGSNNEINNGYNLNFGVMMGRELRKKIVGNKVEDEGAYIYCEYKSDPLSLTVWKENDYKKVAEYKEIAIKTCTEKFLKNISSFLTPAYK